MLLIITNPIAGGGRSLRIQKEIVAHLKEAQLAFEKVETPSNQTETQPNWPQFKKCLVIGGDGTLHRILNYWGIPPIPVALISGGSGNDFCRCTLGTKNWQNHLDIALNGIPKPVDLGRCNGVYFGTGVGIGFDGKIAYLLQKKSFLKGFSRYLAAVLQQVFIYREQPLELHTSEQNFSGKSFMVTVGNTSDFGGGFRVTPEAVPNDGLFQVCLISEVDRLNRLIHLNSVTKGKHHGLRFVKLFNTKRLSLKSPAILHCHMDGEHYFWNEFEIEIKPKAMQLMQPS